MFFFLFPVHFSFALDCRSLCVGCLRDVLKGLWLLEWCVVVKLEFLNVFFSGRGLFLNVFCFGSLVVSVFPTARRKTKFLSRKS